MDSQKPNQPSSDHQLDQPLKPHQPFWSKRNIIVMAATGAVLAGGVAVGFAVTSTAPKADNKQSGDQKQAAQPSGGTSSKFLQDYQGKCEQKDKVTFSSSIIKLSDLAYIEPLGKMSDGHVTPTDHQYWSPTNMNAPDNTYDVLMPADGTIVDIAKMPKQQVGDALSGEKTIQDDHRITIAHSCRYFSIFIHVHKLSDAVTKEVGTLEWGSSKQTNIKLAAGASIGKIGGNPVDWTLLDTTSTLKGLTTPANYEGERWKIHTIDNFSVYTGDLKAQLEAKSIRTAAPVAGKIDYDQPGKLIGTWFRQGSGGYFGDQSKQGQPGYRYWDGHLSIVPDFIDPASTVVSIGNWKGQAQQFTVKGAVGPSSIAKTSGPTKYELLKLNYMTANGQAHGGRMSKGMKLSQTEATQGTVLVEVLDGEKLKVETFPGKTAAQVSGFTAAAQTYER